MFYNTVELGEGWKPKASACRNANDLADDLANGGASALEGQRIPAQGQALGKARPRSPAF